MRLQLGEYVRACTCMSVRSFMIIFVVHTYLCICTQSSMGVEEFMNIDAKMDQGTNKKGHLDNLLNTELL